MKDLQTLVLEWATEKGLLTNVDEDRINKQTHKVLEEIGETCKAYLKNDRTELIDGIGDIAVTLIIVNAMGENELLDLYFNHNKNQKLNLVDVAGAFTEGFTNMAMEALSSFALSQGLKLNDCLQVAYDVISKRTGKMSNGTFIKD